MRLIDADALMEIYMDRLSLVADRYSPDSSECGILTGAVKLLDAQQIIEPEHKTGKWNFIGNQMFECSECGTCYTQSQFYQMRVRISDTEFPKFCPNCGADMR